MRLRLGLEIPGAPHLRKAQQRESLSITQRRCWIFRLVKVSPFRTDEIFAHAARGVVELWKYWCVFHARVGAEHRGHVVGDARVTHTYGRGHHE